IKAKRLKRNLSLKMARRRVLLFARRMAMGARGPSLRAQAFFSFGGGETLAASSSLYTWPRIHSAWVELEGRSGRALSHSSRAGRSWSCCSSALARVEIRKSSSLWTSAWHCSHARAPSGREALQLWQLRIGSTKVVDTMGYSKQG